MRDFAPILVLQLRGTSDRKAASICWPLEYRGDVPIVTRFFRVGQVQIIWQLCELLKETTRVRISRTTFIGPTAMLCIACENAGVLVAEGRSGTWSSGSPLRRACENVNSLTVL